MTFKDVEDSKLNSQRQATRQSVFERNSRKTLVVIVAVSLLIADFAFTALYRLVFQATVVPQASMRTQSEIYHHDLRPMLNGVRSHWGPLAYRTTTNSLGFRDAEARAVTLRSAHPRVLLIGDSFTEGIGVDFEETFAGRVHNELQASGVDVLNAGVMSYCPIIYYRKIKYLLEEVGLEFDYVVVFLDMSDIQDEVIYRLDANGNVVSENASPTAANEEELEAAKPRGWSKKRLIGFVDGNTTVAANLLRRVRSLYRGPQVFYGVNKRRALWTIDEQIFASYGREGLERAQAHMDMLRELLAQHAIPLTVAVYPWPDQVFHGDLNSKQVIFWREWSQNNDAGFLNLFGDFIDPQDKLEALNRYYIPGDTHWNSAGHRVVADAFLRYWNAAPGHRRAQSGM